MESIIWYLACGLLIPYLIHIAVYLKYAQWGRKGLYLPLNLERVFKVNQQVILMLLHDLTLVPLFFRIQAFYKNVKNAIKDVKYNARGQTLDVYLPENAQVNQAKKRHVIIFIYGGSWVSGDKSLYCLMANELTKIGNENGEESIVVVPNYTLYPHSLISEMEKEVEQVVEWVTTNCHLPQYGCGDPNSITLFGHSAGAQLIFAALFNQLENVLTHQGSSSMLNIKGLIGASGVYDIHSHLSFERKRGVEELSGMERVMGLKNS